MKDYEYVHLGPTNFKDGVYGVQCKANKIWLYWSIYIWEPVFNG